VILSLLHYC